VRARIEDKGRAISQNLLQFGGSHFGRLLVGFHQGGLLHTQGRLLPTRHHYRHRHWLAGRDQAK
jgi:hypothetical protein